MTEREHFCVFFWTEEGDVISDKGYKNLKFVAIQSKFDKDSYNSRQLSSNNYVTGTQGKNCKHVNMQRIVNSLLSTPMHY